MIEELKRLGALCLTNMGKAPPNSDEARYWFEARVDIFEAVEAVEKAEKARREAGR